MLRGDLWTAFGKLIEAQKCYEAATAMAAEPSMLGMESWAVALIIRQTCLHAQGKNDDALAGLVSLQKEISPDTLALLYRTLGNIYRSAANWHKAEEHLSMAVEMAKSHGD